MPWTVLVVIREINERLNKNNGNRVKFGKVSSEPKPSEVVE